MSIKITLLRWLATIVAVTMPLGLASASPADAAAAAPAPFCECVIYVQNYIGHINTYYAKDARKGLLAMGYHEYTSPRGINDIVVLQPGFAGADRTARTRTGRAAPRPIS